jgi:hypothetical protein
VFVPFAPLVADSEANLKLGGQTSHLVTGDGSGCLQVLSWVAAPGAPGLGELLPAISTLIEHEWMEVDFSTVTVTENEAGRKSRFDRVIVPKAEVVEHLPDQEKVSLINSKVEIAMIPRLFANQRINAPAAVNPHVNVARLKCLQHLYDIFNSHAIDEHGKSSHALLLLISKRADTALGALRAKHQQLVRDVTVGAPLVGRVLASRCSRPHSSHLSSCSSVSATARGYFKAGEVSS